MITKDNQNRIKYMINDINERITKVYVIDREEARVFKEEVDNIETEATEAADKITKSTPLFTGDDSKKYISQLNDIGDRLDLFLNEKGIKISDIDDINSLELLKETVVKYRECSKNDIEKNAFSNNLIKRLLELMDEGIISVNDSKYFYDCFNPQMVRNAIFEYKCDSLNDIEVKELLNTLDKYNQKEELFNVFVGTEKRIEDKNSFLYPSAYRKTTPKLMNELADIVYGEKINKKEKKKGIRSNLWANTGIGTVAYTLFTKSNGIVVFRQKKFKELDPNHPFFDDVIGCIIEYADLGYQNMKNLEFLYVLNPHYSTISGTPLFLKKNEKIEYVYVKELSYSFAEVNVPNLKEIHYEKFFGTFSKEKFKESYPGNYRLIDEKEEKVLRKVYKR